MQGRFLFLGTGGSMGVPVIGCQCSVCRSGVPKNCRLRASVLVTLKKKRLLIDCGPDFRQQALQHRIDHLDGVLLTHAHHDHIASLDELRVFSMRAGAPFPCLASSHTIGELQARFKYIFDEPEPHVRITPQLTLEALESDRGTVRFQDVDVSYFTYEQGGMPVNGFRFGNLAYVTDIKHYPETLFNDLEGVEILVLSALRFTPATIHLSVDEAIAFSERVGSKETWLTHIAHELDHETANAYLPKGVRVAYDGLAIDFQEKYG